MGDITNWRFLSFWKFFSLNPNQRLVMGFQRIQTEIQKMQTQPMEFDAHACDMETAGHKSCSPISELQ